MRHPRKPIQIAFGLTDYAENETTAQLVALCDDGTMWTLFGPDKNGGTWHRLPDIPQEQPKSEPAWPTLPDLERP